jgi:hypothetical protein
LPAEESQTELKEVLASLQGLPESPWLAADRLCSILLERIERHKNGSSFRDDVASMRAAVGGFLLKRQRRP